MKRGRIVYILFELFVSTISVVSCSWSPLKPFNGWKVGFGKETQVRSLIECAWNCYSTGCRTASFKPQDNTCKTHTNELNKVKKGDADDILWLTKTAGEKLFVGGETYDSFNYVDALAACGEFGASLMSPIDLYDALTAKLSSCRCGWLDDGTQWTIDSPNCNSTTHVRVQCSITALSNAWCIIP